MGADYAMPRRWLTPSRSRAWRWVGVGVVTSRKPGRPGSAGWIWLRQMVARSARRGRKLCTGWPSWVRLVAALASALAERAAGETGLGRAARAAGLSWAVNSIGARRAGMWQAV